MEVKTTLLTEIAAGRATGTQGGNSNNGFADLLGQVTVQATRDNEQPLRRNSTGTPRNETAPQESRRTASTQNRREQAALPADNAQVSPEEPTLTVQQEADAAYVSEENTYPAEEELAEVFEVPAEVVSQVLCLIGMELYDLPEADNLQKFVQAVYYAESPVELLDIEGIPEKMAVAKEIVKQYVQEQSASEVISSEEAEALLDIKPEANYTAGEVIQPEVQQELQEVLVDYGLEQNVTVAKDQTSVLSPLTETVTPHEYAQAEAVPAQQEEAQTTDQQSDNAGFLQQQQQPVAEAKPQDAVNMHQENMVKMSQHVSKASTTATSNVNAQDVIDQIAEKMKVEVRGDMTEMKLTLRPEHLGDLTLRVKTENGIITAHFVAESQRVKEIIESNLNTLRETLQEQGIAVSEFSVTVDHNSQEQRWRDFLFNQEKSARRISQILNRHNGEEEAEATIAAEIPTGATVDFRA